MNPEQLQLECLKLAMEQARREATSDLNRVAELQTWFYNRINSQEPPGAIGRKKASAADKSKDIMS